MSDVVLSASVRQNLLSLQSTAELLATTQNRLATGKKVNSALDNPTNYFTAAALDSRAGDINNLLDGIGNGVQVLQAANTGITSLQKLIDTAKSIANQALQTNVGYTKSNAASIAIPGATASNLLATFGGSASTAAGLALNDNHTAAPVAVDVPGAAIAGTIIANYTDNSAQGTVVNNTSAAPIATGALLNGAAASTAIDLSALATAGDKLTINGVDINFVDPGNASAITGNATTGFNVNVGTGSTATIDNLLSTIDSITGGGPSAIVGGKLELHTGGNAGSDIDFTGSDAAALSALGLTTVAAAGISRTGGAQTPGSLVSATTKLAPAGGATSLTTTPADGSSIVINGQTISFSAATATTSPPTSTGSTINIGTGTIADVIASINAIVGPGSASIDGTGALKINSGVTADLNVADGTTPSGALAALGLTGAAGNHPRGVGAVVPAQVTNASTLSGTASPTSTGLSTALAPTDTITINGKTISFHAGDALTTGTAAAGNLSIGLNATVADVLSAIDAYSGGSGSQVLNGRATLVAGTGADLVISDGQAGATLAKLGLSAGTTPKSTSATSGLTGLTLNIAATGDSTTPTNIVFGTAPGEVSTLDQLNAELMKNNLQASISTTGKITITTTNDAASSNIGAITGSATDPGNPFSGVAIDNSTRNPNSQATRAGLVSQYNNIIDQIRTTAQDASFNGINLLNGDQLKLVFNETGTSQLNITGTALDPAGLGLGSLVGGTDFIDNSSTNKILASLNTASGMLRSQASTLGSNLSIVQIRQDFSKNLINVLQTGSANLTIADTNEEAANSQALATRQSIAVSALALANQSQQSVLKLLQ